MTDLPIIDSDYAEPPEPPMPNRRPRWLIAAIAVLPLLGVTALIARGSSDGAGASSPEAAVQKLADAIDHEDVMGAIAVLPPEEVDGVQSLYDTIKGKLADTHVIESSDKPLQGLDFKVTDLKLSSERLADDVSLVRFEDGRIEADFDPAKLSTRERALAAKDARPAHQSAAVADGRKALADAGSKVRDVFVMTVRRDGHWYVSPSYTLAEYLREAFDLPAAHFDSAATGNGAANAKAAVEQWLHDSVKLNTDSINDLPPDRYHVVYDYRPTIQAAIDNLGLSPDEAPKIAFTDISLDQQALSAHTAKVEVNTLKGTVASSSLEGDGAPVRFELNGLCGTITPPPSLSSRPEFDTQPQTGCLSDVPVKLPFDKFFVVSREVAGKWYVDPLATFIEYAQEFAAKVGPKDVDCVIAHTADQSTGLSSTDQTCPGTMFGN